LNTIRIIAVAGLFCANLSSADVEAADASVQPPVEIKELLTKLDEMLATVQEIGSMAAADQFVRLTFMDFLKGRPMSPEEKMAFEQVGGGYIDEIDQANTARLKVLLKKVSWADLADIKPDVAADAWMIVQHSDDLDFQQQTLGEIKPLVDAGKMDGSTYANMFDRIARKQGKKQTYGTQTVCENGQIVSSEIEDAEHVDDRRAGLGLEPVDAYLERLRKMYPPC